MIEVSTYYGIDISDSIESVMGLTLDNGNKGSFHLFGEVIDEINSSMKKNTYFITCKDERNVITGIFFAVEVKVGEPHGDSEARFRSAKNIVQSIFSDMEAEIKDLYKNQKSSKFLNKSLSVSNLKEFLDKFSILQTFIKNDNVGYINVVESY